MSSFIANASNQGTGNSPATIANNGFFPDIDIAAMRDRMRIDSTITTPRLVDAATQAIIHVNQQLSTFKASKVELGFTKLSEIPGETIGNESVLISQYLRAVYSIAKADLIERYKDYDTTASSLDDKKMIEFLSTGPDECRRNAQWAISDLVGRNRSTIELI
jgi:hypothetical protein